MDQFEQQLLAQALAETEPFAPAVVAAKFVAKIREKQPKELERWLDEHAEVFATDRLGEMLRSHRARALHRAPVERFSRAAKQSEDGDDSGLVAIMAATYEVNDAHERLPLGEMRRPDLTFAAGSYDAQSKALAMEAAFLRALAKKCGASKRVADVFDPVALGRLRDSIIGT